MRILFATDLHGRRWEYDHLLEVARRIQPDVVINGGDMLPKGGDQFSQGGFITGYLEEHFAQFNDAGIHYLCYLGNDDLRIFDELFEETCAKFALVTNLAQRKCETGGYEFVGMNWVVDYPFRLKDRCRMDTDDYVFQEQFGTGLLSTRNGWRELDDWPSYARTLPTIEDELKRLERPKDMSCGIYVGHMPPCDLGLDRCGHGVEVGSRAIYEFLRTEQPKLALHGHIHESPECSGKWRARLGNTICIQPGQLTPLTFVTIDLDTMEIHRCVEHP